ncbi:glycine receptor subunit alphaz1-like protein [Leptotrombidium deliense]|uniref:Glycine receptor subunit alphaz1-like protein n=1 Tax=Leptotrombidium deliense TaxID=299467 RepID=A0A443SF20_9ACAR|nr:glycine receptor subunit alphaz1-like protein [Leptotrombidium deliense]
MIEAEGSGYDVMPARVILCVTTVLALVTQYTAVKNGLPPVSYATAVDIWMILCMLFIIFAICTLTLGYKWSRRDIVLRYNIANLDKTVNIWPYKWAVKPHYNPKIVPKGDLPAAVSTHQPRTQTVQMRKSRSAKLDRYCRILHPIAFTSFGIAYWGFLYLKLLLTDDNKYY